MPLKSPSIARRHHLEDARVGRTVADELEVSLRIDAELGASNQRLGDQSHLTDGRKIVDQLDLVSGTDSADVKDVFAERLQCGLDFLERGWSAPTMVLSRPCSASTGVRVSGASTKRAPFAFSSSAILQGRSGLSWSTCRPDLTLFAPTPECRLCGR